MAIHEANTLPHACEAQPSALLGRFDVKPLACVTHDKVNFVCALHELDFKPFDSAVLDDVVQGVLKNAK